MESALGNESEHVPDKTSGFAVLDKQKAIYKEAVVNKNMSTLIVKTFLAREVSKLTVDRF